MSILQKVSGITGQKVEAAANEDNHYKMMAKAHEDLMHYHGKKADQHIEKASQNLPGKTLKKHNTMVEWHNKQMEKHTNQMNNYRQM